MAIKNKYHNKKVTINGITFDSKKERDRYIVLKEAQDKGIISGLELQPTFELIPKITDKIVKRLKTKVKVVERVVQRPITYTADFSYYKGLERVIEDVKISPRLLPKEFTLKVKMMRYFHGITVKFVYKATEEI